MQKSLCLSLAVCLALTGCQVFQKSQTWEKVSQVRPDPAPDNGDPSAAYAEKLHRVLSASHIDHKIITYQYRYTTRLREEAVGTRTAVVYKDNSDPHNPWWLMDDRLGKPVWLPNDQINRQVGFYLHHDADVVEQKEFRGLDGEKEMLASVRPATETRRATAAVKALPKPAAAPAQVVQARPAAPAPLAKYESAPATQQTAPTPPAPRATLPWLRPAAFAAAPREFAANHLSPIAAESRYDAIFRVENGTDFDPASSLDRRKMEQLKQVLAGPERSF